MSFSAATPLNPAYFLDRAAKIFSNRTAIVDGHRRFTYGEFGERSHRLAGLLRKKGAQQGDRIARFKAPREIRFEGLPKTSTGKIQKYILRRRLSQQASEEQIHEDK